MTVDDIITGIIKREGSEFTNHADDAGGPTKYGITQATLAAWRDHPVSVGDVQALTEAEARSIYRNRYYIDPGFALLENISMPLTVELTDTGVNMGVGTAAKFLQRSLNALNLHASRYADVSVDGNIGLATLAALHAFLAWRGKEGETVLLKALNCLQGERYIELAEKREQNESFVYGWIKERIQL